MANELNNLIPILHAALQQIARELIGIIPAVTRNMTADAAAVGQIIRVPITPVSENSDVIPGTPPVLEGTKFGYRDVVINKQRRAKPIVWTGNEQVSLGGQLNPILVNQYAQSIRSLVNEMEVDLALELILGAIEAGNVYGTPGTPPLNGSLADLAQVAKILDDAPAPTLGRQFVANTMVGANLRSLTHLTSVADSGNDDMLRRGIFGNLIGFDVRQSAGFKTISPGTGSGYLINGGNVKGDKELIVDVGSGVIKKGAIVTIAGDSNKYIVTEDMASGGTVLKIAGGLKQDAADDAAITVGVAYLPSAAFTTDAIVLATRLPAIPEGGDKAKDTYTMTDPISGLSLQAALYGEYLQNFVELRVAWGCKSVNPEFSCALIG